MAQDRIGIPGKENHISLLNNNWQLITNYSAKDQSISPLSQLSSISLYTWKVLRVPINVLGTKKTNLHIVPYEHVLVPSDCVQYLLLSVKEDQAEPLWFPSYGRLCFVVWGI